MLRDVRIAGDHFSEERLRAVGYSTADATQTDDTKGLVRQTPQGPQQEWIPLAGPHIVRCANYPPGESEEQRHGVVRHLWHAVTRYVDHRDALLLSGLQVNVVYASVKGQPVSVGVIEPGQINRPAAVLDRIEHCDAEVEPGCGGV